MTQFLFIALFVVVLVAVAWFSVRRDRSKAFAKGDVLFRSSFPELQPHFHPENVAAFVAARRARKAPSAPYRWNRPPGFAAAEAADLAFVKKGEEYRLLGPGGALLAAFVFAEHPGGGIVRLGEGKFTVDLYQHDDPKVRYWHPKREFKWSRRGGWKVLSALAEAPIESTRDTMRMSDSDSSSWSSSGSGSASSAFSGGGGTFDGGGASGGWDDASTAGGGSGSGAAAASDDSGGSGSSSDASSSESATSY